MTAALWSSRDSGSGVQDFLQHPLTRKSRRCRHTTERGYQAERAHAALQCNFYCAAAALLSGGFTEHAFVVKMLFLYQFWMDGALAASPRSECQIQSSTSTIDFARGVSILNICESACRNQMRLLQSDHSM